MKKLLLLLILTTGLLSACKKSFQVRITGKFELPNSKLRIVDDDEHKTNDEPKTIYGSSRVVDGKINLDGEFKEPGFYSLELIDTVKDQRWYTTLYVEPGASYFVDGKTVDGWPGPAVDVTSSSYTERRLNDLNHLWRQKHLELSGEIARMQVRVDQALDKGQMEQYRNLANAKLKLELHQPDVFNDAFMEFMQKNPDVVVTPYYISRTPDLFEGYSLYKKAFEKLSPDVKESKYGLEALKKIKQSETLYLGGKVPDLHGEDLNNKPFSYDYSKNKLTLLDFWASWNYECYQQSAAFKKIHANYKERGFDIIGVAVDPSKGRWRNAVKRDKLPWYNVCEGVNGSESKNVQNFAVKKVPRNYLVNSQGIIVGRDILPDSLDRRLKEL